ncbi:MAG TPA: serine--tRNA ligase [Candidatus Nanoarchaeia archaeon]|nr:serine--tRNA ligase [Candidatus Nanoarchaeia archaeon]
MLDINLLREHPGIVKANQKKANQSNELVDEILQLDKKWRGKKHEVDNLRSGRNKISEEINIALKKADNKLVQELIKKAKKIPEQILEAEEESDKLKIQIDRMLSRLPNIISNKTPEGKDSSENVEIKKIGKIPVFNFPIKTHVELIESLKLGDFEASAKTSGNGFYYLKNELAILNQALIKFAVDYMGKKGYEYIEPPLMIKKDIITASEGLESLQNSIYEVKDTDLVLIGTAEHALMAMHKDYTFKEQDLPKKYFAYSMCFRKEIGSHGINEKGLWRTHQFNKIEQFIFCLPEDSEKYYDELLANSEGILKELKLPYRVLEICTGDLAKWKHRSADLEVYRPTTKEYGEVMSLSNITDYQARDHNIKVVRKSSERQVVHTLNNTALATSRILVCILENNQNKNGSITIPVVLQKYTGFKKIEAKISKVKSNKVKKKTKR